MTETNNSGLDKENNKTKQIAAIVVCQSHCHHQKLWQVMSNAWGQTKENLAMD